MLKFGEIRTAVPAIVLLAALFMAMAGIGAYVTLTLIIKGADTVVVPDLDGSEFKGSGPVGPPFTQEDFNRLAELGANYVSISGPGLFIENPPYTVDPGVQENLDNLLAMIAEAEEHRARVEAEAKEAEEEQQRRRPRR